MADGSGGAITVAASVLGVNKCPEGTVHHGGMVCFWQEGVTVS